MKKMISFASAGVVLLAGSAFAGPTTVDYLTPFSTGSFGGLSSGAWQQAGQVITIPNAVSVLNTFSLGFYDSNNTPLYGQIQAWTGTAAGATLYQSSNSLDAQGSSALFGSYRNFTFDLGATPLAVTPGQQIFLSLTVPTGSFSGNMAWYGSPNNYSGGYIGYKIAGNNYTDPSSMAFGATFDAAVADAPEPATVSIMFGGLALLAVTKRRLSNRAV